MSKTDSNIVQVDGREYDVRMSPRAPSPEAKLQGPSCLRQRST